MKIVKFKDGKYGVRRGVMFFYSFLDMRKFDFWWTIDEHIINYCHGTFENAINGMKIHTGDKGTVVRDK